MPKARACIRKLDGSVPFRSRLEFVEGLAAIAAEFPEDMLRKVTGANKAIDQILWCAAAADRAEWLLNNLRWRHRLGLRDLTLLPCGTTSNEALHAEIKGWFAQTQQIHQSTLKLKLEILTLAKMLPHYAAAKYPTLSQATSRHIIVRLCTPSIWTPQSWLQRCDDSQRVGRIAKAKLPLAESRQSERVKVQKWNLKRPAAAEPRHRKRTVFTLQRKSKLCRQGVRA
ncbi:unnamed protein product [Symbiodinium microadriaticum]|nr:unnamed protein product [Symbiodinium microadriaticum]